MAWIRAVNGYDVVVSIGTEIVWRSCRFMDVMVWLYKDCGGVWCGVGIKRIRCGCISVREG